MIQVKIVNVPIQVASGTICFEDKVNAKIEELERAGMRVRSVDVQYVLGVECNVGGFATIYYDDSANYYENPEEIEDLYHRKGQPWQKELNF